MGNDTCTNPGCVERAFARGLCNPHYKRARRAGLTVLPKPSVAERFWSKVQVAVDPDGCLMWTGSRTSVGYGNFRLDGKTVLAHRFAYQALIGSIPDGLVLDHLCRNRRCVNPAHLEPVTDSENIRRGHGFAFTQASKTHCPKNHPYDEANTYRLPSGGRVCRICARASKARNRAAKRSTVSN